MRVTSLILATALLFLLPSAQAASYSVQIGAYKDPAAAETTRASDIGEITMHPGRDGLTRIRVGHFESEQDAQLALQRVRSAGYADAYISNERGRAVGHQQQRLPHSLPMAYSEDQRLNAAKAKIPADQHGNIVYLDGQLTLKEGNTFRSLE